MSQKTFSINRKLVFFVMIVSLSAITVTSFLSFNSAEKILKESTQDLLIGEASIRGVAKPSFVVSHEINLDEAPTAYEKFDKRIEGYTKVLIHPQD